MPKLLDLDFRGAPPSQGGGSDIVPPGSYHLRVAKVTDPSNKSNNGKPMVVVSFRIMRGEHQGKRIEDRFVFPAAPEDSLFGKQRFNAFLQCLGYTVPQDRAFRFDLDTLIGRQITAELVAAKIPATKERPERDTMNISEYADMTKPAANATNGAAPVAGEQPAPASQTASAPPQAATAPVAAPPAESIAEPDMEIPSSNVPLDEEPVVVPPPDDDEFPFT